MSHKVKTFIFLFLSLTCLVLTHFIYNKYGKISSETNNKQVIGFFSEINNNVMRKFSDRLLWIEGRSGDSLFENEAIKTNKNSSSKISLNSGSSITIEENSMVILNQDSNNLSLNILDGKILLQAKNKENLKIQNGDKLINIKDATVVLSKKENESSIQVIEGEVSTDSVTIKSGESLETVKGGSSIKKNTFSNFNPRQENSTILSLEQEDVTFSWNKDDKSETNFFIGTDPLNLISSKIKANKITKNLPIGKYYWKVSDSTEESPLFSIEIKEVSTSVSISPKDVILFNNPYLIEFQYSNADTKVLSIEYSEDETFKIKKIVKENSVSLSKGKYYWRIKQSFKNKVFYSKVESFEVEDKPKDVQISFKNDQSDLWYIETPKIDLKWESTFIQFVSRWKIITKQNSQENTFFSSNNEALVSLKNDYPVSIKVIALDKYDNILGSQEKIFKFIKAPSPVIPEIASQYTADKNGVFSFNEKKSYEECSIKVKNKFYEKSLDCSKEDIVFKDLMPGQYEVIIEVVDKFNRKLSNRSPSSLIVPQESAVNPPKMKKVKVDP